MNRDDVVAKVKVAVEIAEELPERFQVAAFQVVALDLLSDSMTRSSVETRPRDSSPSKAPSNSSSVAPKTTPISEDQFFSQLSNESGFSEIDLRSVFHLASDGVANLLLASKDLGANRAEQARTVIVLVAGARAYGLGERPVSLNLVRDQARRRNCYDHKKFVSDDLGVLRAFHSGSRGEILVTPRWLEEFRPAMDRALGRKPSVNE